MLVTDDTSQLPTSWLELAASAVYPWTIGWAEKGSKGDAMFACFWTLWVVMMMIGVEGASS
jgi:hypothetical protein